MSSARIVLRYINLLACVERNIKTVGMRQKQTFEGFYYTFYYKAVYTCKLSDVRDARCRKQNIDSHSLMLACDTTVGFESLTLRVNVSITE